MTTDWSEGGSTVKLPPLDTPFNVAVMVTGVTLTTCPAVSWNCTSPAEPGTGMLAGTGAAAGLELTSASVAPAAGTAAVSCTWTNVLTPLNSGEMSGVTETGAGGADDSVNACAGDHAVSASVVGEAIPCAERTRQNLLPAESENTWNSESVSCAPSGASLTANVASGEICTS